MPEPNAELSQAGNKEREKDTSSRNRSRREQARESAYNEVKVLLLTFKFNDLKLDGETAKVKKAFDDLGYSVTHHDIEMDKSTENLRAEIKKFQEGATSKTLLIVYYHGHGGLGTGNRLRFVSHKYPQDVGQLWNILGQKWKPNSDLPAIINDLREEGSSYQLQAKIAWDGFKNDIMSAKSDALFILDCCHAGFAAVDVLDAGKSMESKNSNQNNKRDDSQSENHDIDDHSLSCSREDVTSNKRGDCGKDEKFRKKYETTRIKKDNDEECPKSNKQRISTSKLEPKSAKLSSAKAQSPLQKALKDQSENETCLNTSEEPTPHETKLQPRKELIGACGWGIKTRNHMSPAMCDVLKTRCEPGDSISASYLASCMNNSLARLYKGPGTVPQAVHYVLRLSKDGQDSVYGEPMAGKIVLPCLSKKARPACKKDDDKPSAAPTALKQ